MNNNMQLGEANWRVAEMEAQDPKAAVYLASLGLLIGVIAGVVISVFRISKDAAYAYALSWTDATNPSFSHYFIWFFLIYLAALGVGWLVRNPAIRFGGAAWIGQTLAKGQKNPWLKILFPKFIGSWLVLAFGVSVGSEGPCIQMGAATAVGLKKFDAKQKIERKFFILGGCAAGLAAAFSAPFVGIFYVYEIMHEKMSRPLFVFLLASGIGVFLSCDLLFGLGTMLPIGKPVLPDLAIFWILLPLGIVSGITGIAYNYALYYSIKIYATQKIIPQFWRPMLPFGVAAVLMIIFPAITGEGMGFLNNLPAKHDWASFLSLFILLKLLFTAFCYGSGIPAGMMVPILCLGGVTGVVYADWLTMLDLLPTGMAPTCMAMGMAGAFAAAERAPLTGMMLVTEITGGYAAMPGLLLVAAVGMIAARVARVKDI